MMLKVYFLLAITLCWGCSDENSEQQTQQHDKQVNAIVEQSVDPTHLLFRYEISNPSNKLIKNSFVAIAIPNNLSNRHQLRSLDINVAHSIQTDDIGNQTVLIEFSEFAPFATQLITIKAELTPYLVAVLPTKKPEVVAESELVPYLHADIQEVAKQFEALSEKELITQSYNWVVRSLQYSGYSPDDRGALFALYNRRGDCTEYMYLLAALLRVNKVPSRLVAGYVYERSRLVDAADYHNWVEVFIDGKWLIVDAQKEQLLVDSKDYITMRYLDSPDPSIQQSQRFFVSDKLKVKMY